MTSARGQFLDVALWQHKRIAGFFARTDTQDVHKRLIHRDWNRNPKPFRLDGYRGFDRGETATVPANPRKHPAGMHTALRGVVGVWDRESGDRIEGCDGACVHAEGSLAGADG
jgi:hypothetical protein